jgi:TRAP-type mannitol/chloroaromatic compound transport system permease small subunit
MRRILNTIDTISEFVGSWGRWFVVALILVGVFEVTMRYVFNAPTIWAYETSSMLGGTVYALGWAFALLHKSHIRVDVFFSRLSQRGQAIADSILAAVFFFPLIGMMAYRAVFWAERAWSRNLVMMESYWYAPQWPFRFVLAFGICLLLVQGIAKFVRDMHFAVKGTTID